MSPAEPLHSRVDLACEQLDVAIELFFADRSFVSALTLAGAAEEILGTELKNRGGQSTIARRHAEHQRLYQRLQDRWLYPNVRFKLRSWADFIKKANYARNAAKHIEDKTAPREAYDQFFRDDPRAAAISMVLRAMHNQEMLGLPKSDLGHRFYGWHLSTIYSDESDEA